MRWMLPPDGIECAILVLREPSRGRHPYRRLAYWRLILPRSFQVCGIKADGVVVFELVCGKNEADPAAVGSEAFIVDMKACATSHHLGRLARALGHEVRIIAAIHVKFFLKRQKKDFADAAAIAAAASRFPLSFVAVKSGEKQARAFAFRTHQCFVRQRTQLINALRGHVAEFGLVAQKGPAHRKVLQAALNGPDIDLPAPVRQIGRLCRQQIGQLTEVITRLADALEAAARTDDDLRRLCPVPPLAHA